MRVLHLYAGNLYGGVETFLVTLARHRELSNMQPEFGLCFEGRLSRELIEQNVPVHLLGEVRFSRPWTVLNARRKLRRLLAEHKYDVAICHSAWPHAVFAPVLRRAGVPQAFWAHNPPGRQWLDRLAGRTKPALLIGNSDYTLCEHNGMFDGCARTLLRLPVSAARVDQRQSARDKVRRELGAKDDEIVIVCTSRLEAWKGHRLLLEALSMLSETKGWSAWIAGGPQRAGEDVYLAELKSLAARLQIAPRVRFIGQRNDIPDVLCAADIHCQPNTGPEPFGIAFIEALYAGLPVVTTAMGAAAEIVTRDCGILTAPNASEVSAALRKLIVEPACRRALAGNGPARAAELCDPANTLRQMELELLKLTNPEN